jgi:3-phenylpropionate/trans-cinnamate dioxygenase ferredoxin reductase subunit
MSDSRTFVIVGAGQAGRWIVNTLRAQGFDGRIVWIGAEAHAPYERPPLSKALLKGETTPEKLALVTPERFAEWRVDWHAGTTVSAIDRAARRVATHDGRSFDYDVLFLATGGRARTLPEVPAHPRIATLRTLEDAHALRRSLEASRRVLVLGGGWIGLEVAATARTLGREVTVVEAAPRLCARTVPPRVSDILADSHRTHGVTLRLGQAVTAVEPREDRVVVGLADGTMLEGDLLVVGIGLVADDALAASAGLPVAGGILVDAQCRTDDPAIFAVGDVANALRPDGQRRRMESWENAERQGITAARAALGLPAEPLMSSAPWFWSDQYDDNLQILGEPAEDMSIIERHVPDRRARVLFLCTGRRVRAVAAVNAGREVKVARKWMNADRYPDLALLADPANDLNKLPVAAP